MKTILLWDQRFPDRKPLRLTVDDAVASAAVRSGAGAAANAAEAGALNVGGSLSADYPVDIALTHGVNATSVARVAVPLAVAQVAEAAGLAARIPFAETYQPNAVVTDDGTAFIISSLDGAQIVGDRP